LKRLKSKLQQINWKQEEQIEEIVIDNKFDRLQTKRKYLIVRQVLVKHLGVDGDSILPFFDYYFNIENI